MPSSDIARLLRDLERAGVQVRHTGGKHIQVMLPNGQILTVASTPRNQGQAKWVRAKLHKAGVNL
jgi:predicted RNA binding protein YcfA (HicA-like mRNA interferase family)